MESEKETSENKQIGLDKIKECIAILEQLNDNAIEIFGIPKDDRKALLMAAGLLSRPSREEFNRRKKLAKKAEKNRVIPNPHTQKIILTGPSDRINIRFNRLTLNLL